MPLKLHEVLNRLAARAGYKPVETILARAIVVRRYPVRVWWAKE